ncbi:PAS domain-containing sensor histidine kinase [Terrimonas sp. NA20]|uniref:histidine kinase n=1 Tax=Terrimonas ginsenosidimutans TaxID=2908004 RepID=A0ABS9KVE4_9BACT|nr:PAS domain-containing sensor histidine kinase [Terrimonas ginsenosidimutans]MCG2616296.1 PAS domain-containing sensor histidine kinase [Terrimonas ginsenosidimutans]
MRMSYGESSSNINSETIVEALFNSIRESAAIISKNANQPVFCNAAWRKMFGAGTSDQLAFHQFNQLRKIPLSVRELQIQTRMIEEKGVFTEQVEYLSANSKPFRGDTTIRTMANNGDLFYLIVIDRIDSLKESKLRLIRNRQGFNVLLEYASIGILEVNRNAEIININLFALRLFGYNKQDVLSKNIEMLIPHRFRNDHQQHRDQYFNQPEHRLMGMGIDLYALKKNGAEFPVEISLSNYTFDNEKLTIAFISDISVRKKNEQEIRNLNNALEQPVESRTKELKNAIHNLEVSKDELSKSLLKERELSELKSRFISMASHEFRTPLSTILSSAFLLDQYNTGEEQPKREKHIRRIVSSANMLTDTLNDFLSVGMIEEGKIHTRISEINIQNAIGSAIEEITVNLKKGQKISYIHDGDLSVRLDPSLLKHIIMNLVSNASKFSPENSIIQIRTSTQQYVLMLSVKDQGIGISRDDQKHLMERFFRGTNAVNIQGTGIGLHIVAKYAELMHGKIQCISELKKGTKFILSFNLNETPDEKDPAN